MRRALTVALLLAVCAAARAQAQPLPASLVNPGDGGAATAASLAQPTSVAPAPAGGFLLADAGHNSIRWVRPNGVIVTIAGTGALGDDGDGGSALNARLSHPLGIATAPDGSVVIADTGNDRVRKVTPDGRIETIAGTGTEGFSGDRGPATSAELADPVAVAMTPDGGVVFADRGNDRVRRIGPGGEIGTVAGGGTQGDIRQGGSATAAELDGPAGVAVTADGGLLVADAGHHAIRHVSYGVIATVAGSGNPGAAVADGVARDQEMASPSGLTVARDGSFLFADTEASLVRRVRQSGAILTLAGTGRFGDAQHGERALDAELASPSGLAILPSRSVLIAEGGADRIRAVRPNGTVVTVAGRERSRTRPLARQFAAARGTHFYLRGPARVKSGCLLKLVYHTVERGTMRTVARSQRFRSHVEPFDHFVRIRVRLRPGRYKLMARVAGVGRDRVALHVLRNPRKRC